MDIMLDLETLGKKPGCVVLSIGAMIFDPAGSGVISDGSPGKVKPFYQNIDVFSSLMLGLEIDPNTLGWWRGETSKEAKEAIWHPRGNPLVEVLDSFSDWIIDTGKALSPQVRNVTIWAKSPEFDCAIIEHCCDLVRVPIPWEFCDKRDVRTVVDLRRMLPIGNFPPPQNARVGVHHNALDDCAYQIAEVQAALKGLSYGTA